MPRPMLFFYCADADALDAIREDGLHDPDGLPLYTRLSEATAACEGVLLAIDPERVPGTRSDRPTQVPPEAIGNLTPEYVPVVPVTAGGGYVVRPGPDEPDVLLIYRRGAWDLPKGKQDPGETIDACALREVREEIGVETVRMVDSLGTTVHGYLRNEQYHVKTTHWYLMMTPERDFQPEEREGIDEVAWVSWQDAIARLDYATLQRHMRSVTDAVRAAIMPST
ncbi:MAG: NUDIX domain-containing protein [Bacteroidetes bacterium]|nr:NUDIX domain-containing protein [Bacteroidota bacterium]